MCGEKRASCRRRAKTDGSPPRVRGKGSALPDSATVMGITPACAGKRRRATGCGCRAEDHPRVCGEKNHYLESKHMYLGSPPRVRGKEAMKNITRTIRRITPACAGKSAAAQGRRRRGGDHPRVCGEKHAQDPEERYAWGSPPRVRGKATVLQHRGGFFGITPACAGKRGGQQCSIISTRDHPRVCGEKGTALHLIFPIKGSPPRVRGKGRGADLGRGAAGITPACAGKRPVCVYACFQPRDHPRVCGEKCSPDFFATMLEGSPPRVRGKGTSPVVPGVIAGITPACAGKSLGGRKINIPVGDHPRVCGEKLAGRSSTSTGAGSPPRVRGKVEDSEYNGAAVRITPACAGKRLKKALKNKDF